MLISDLVRAHPVRLLEWAILAALLLFYAHLVETWLVDKWSLR